MLFGDKSFFSALYIVVSDIFGQKLASPVCNSQIHFLTRYWFFALGGRI